MPTQIINVLLIEDDAVDAEAIERVLTQQEQRFSIEWVKCLQEGIDIAHVAEVDVILTDLRLPDADGLESVRALRHGYPHVPIIALTGAEESIGLLTIRAGASDFLPKEKINRELLKRSIDYALERHRMRFELQRTNRELVGKNQKLAHVSRLSERFVSNVARQFLDPLESICEQSDQLRDSLSEQLAPQNLIMLNQLAEETDRLAGIARNLIDSNQFGSGEISVHRRSTSISEFIEQPLASLQEMVEGKQIDLQVAYPDDKQSASVFCDAQQVQRLLYNLVHNAIKFTPESGQITIKVNRIGHQVRISVSDSGFGIPQEQQSLIFERFEQFAVNKHNKTPDGLGLGLSIAKRLSETNLGSLTVQSQVGCGSQFTLLLPSDDSHAALKCYLDQRTEADDEDGVDGEGV